MSGWLRRWWPAIVAHVALVVLWQAAAVWGDVPSFVMPTPLATLRALSQPHYNWLQHTLVTAAEVFGGHALVVVIGIGMAILFSWSSVLERFLMPLDRHVQHDPEDRPGAPCSSSGCRIPQKWDSFGPAALGFVWIPPRSGSLGTGAPLGFVWFLPHAPAPDTGLRNTAP